MPVRKVSRDVQWETWQRQAAEILLERINNPQDLNDAMLAVSLEDYFAKIWPR